MSQSQHTYFASSHLPMLKLQEVICRYSADGNSWAPMTHYTLNATKPASASGHAYSFDAAAGKWV